MEKDLLRPFNSHESTVGDKYFIIIIKHGKHLDVVMVDCIV